MKNYHIPPRQLLIITIIIVSSGEKGGGGGGSSVLTILTSETISILAMSMFIPTATGGPATQQDGPQCDLWELNSFFPHLPGLITRRNGVSLPLIKPQIPNTPRPPPKPGSHLLHAKAISSRYVHPSPSPAAVGTFYVTCTHVWIMGAVDPPAGATHTHQITAWTTSTWCRDGGWLNILTPSSQYMRCAKWERAIAAELPVIYIRLLGLGYVALA